MIRKYYEQVDANRFNYLDITNTGKIQTSKKINNLNKSTSTKETESVDKKFPDGFIDEL